MSGTGCGDGIALLAFGWIGFVGLCFGVGHGVVALRAWMRRRHEEPIPRAKAVR